MAADPKHPSTDTVTCPARQRVLALAACLARASMILALLALATLARTPPALAEDDDGRKDVTIGNPDRARSGVNERGDNEMVIERKPKRKQEMPDLGNIYVVPQVNQGGAAGGTPPVIIVPQQPAQPQRPQPGQPAAPGQPGQQGPQGQQGRPKP